MGYYMGDYYAGYRGDPGFFDIIKRIGGAAIGLLPGGGTVTKIAQGVASIAAKHPKATAIIKGVGAQVMKHPVLSAAGAAGAVTAGTAAAIVKRGSKAGAGMAMMGPNGAGGRIGGRRRRMNVCNPKALRRSIRRTQGFAKLAMKTIHLVHPKKHVLFGGFRKKRKKR